ncbi:MAG: hypothetical protein OXG18_05175, partial [Gemmatimonadetes bacterium]|nr:hypothetical protein [Gemmatimonadota bacterium]
MTSRKVIVALDVPDRSRALALVEA